MLGKRRILATAPLLLAAAALWAALPAGAAQVSAPAPAAGPTLGRPAVAAASTPNDYLNTVSCLPAAGQHYQCVAAGWFAAPGAVPGLGEFSGGGAWALTSQMPGAPRNSAVVLPNEISCAAGNQHGVCLMIGQHYSNPKNSYQLAESYSTQSDSWTLVNAFNPPGATWAALTDVACPSTTFCFVTGVAGTSTGRHATAYTWDGASSWSRLTVPSPQGAKSSELAGLACLSTTKCVAVGNFLSSAGHWLSYAATWTNGTWVLHKTPNVAGVSQSLFQAISCPSGSQCVAVGQTLGPASNSPWHPFAEVVNSGVWQLLNPVRPSASSAFFSVSCVPGTAGGAAQCFASGFHGSLALVENWNAGTNTWTQQTVSQVKAPLQGGLFHVSCVSSTSCVAVGGRFNPRTRQTLTLAEGWNGKSWLIQKTVNQ